MECCARKAAVAQGSVAAVVGSGGGIGNDGTDNGHTRTVVGTSGSAGKRTGEPGGTGLGLLDRQGAGLRWRAGHERAQGRGGSGGNTNGMKMSPPPPPPPLPFL